MPGGRSDAAAPPNGAALAALPLVGAAIGSLAGFAGFATARVAPRPLPAAVALGTSIVLSGALHLDGFLDGCDAFFASVPPERRREILKDPRHGTFALAGLAVAGSLWFAALDALPPRRLPASLTFASALARAAVVPYAFVFPDVRSAGSAPGFVLRRGVVPLALQIAFLAFAGSRLRPRAAAVPAALTVPAALVGAAATLRWCANRLGGGLTGDAYGFAIVVLEVAILTTLAARSA